MKHINYLILVAVATTSMATKACDLTIQQFVDLDISTRLVTIEGMKERLVLLERYASDNEMMEADDKNRLQVTNIFTTYSCTSNQVLHFSNENGQSISEYIDTNDGVQTSFENIQNDFDTVSAQISAIKQNEF